MSPGNNIKQTVVIKDILREKSPIQIYQNTPIKLNQEVQPKKLEKDSIVLSFSYCNKIN